ncbi:hypothetical protein V2J09_011728 [Rumex salicifolius]
MVHEMGKVACTGTQAAAALGTTSIASNAPKSHFLMKTKLRSNDGVAPEFSGRSFTSSMRCTGVS